MPPTIKLLTYLLTYYTTGKAVKFRIAGPVGGLEKSMSENHKRVHKSGLRDSKVVEVETDTLANILDRNEAPRFIEYLSLDIEGAL